MDFFVSFALLMFRIFASDEENQKDQETRNAGIKCALIPAFLVSSFLVFVVWRTIQKETSGNQETRNQMRFDSCIPGFLMSLFV